MVVIEDALIDNLESQCQSVLGVNGRLSRAIPDFLNRSQQTELATAIAHAILDNSILVAEAGTGTGKTFAYLVPSLLSKKKVIISTATKTLQDQLYKKDLPLLINGLGVSACVQNLKGRANYLCLYRINMHAEQGRFNDARNAHEVMYIREKLPQLTHGERSELPEISEDSSVWNYVTSTSDNCLGAECELYQKCYLVKARKKAMESDIVVINHHLFFADSQLKADGFGELLPGVEVVVFDEAHQLAEIATQLHGERLSTRQFRDLMDDILREWPPLDLANQPLQSYSHALDKVINALLMVHFKEERLSWDNAPVKRAYSEPLAELEALTLTVLDCFASQDLENHQGLARCKERLEAQQNLLKKFLKPTDTTIRWIERFKNTLVLHATPFEIATAFKKTLKKECSYIFTSATLTMAESFAFFNNPLGLEQVKTLLLHSPFEFSKQALLYLPRDLPDPKQQEFYEILIMKTLPIINALQGRCFFLFTGHSALQKVAARLRKLIPFPVLVQGEESKPILLSKFRELGNAVLLGTATFWEGVDVKGDALSCVIIDKLPFASPNDPLMRGKMNYLKERGVSPFDELTLPNAVIALKQGVGRLIRDISDKGVLMIADPRLSGRAYGKQIFDSLPKMRKTREEQTVLNFIQQLAITDEAISN